MTFASPLLAAIPGLRHAFFTRDGGISEGIYGSLNGGIGSKDDPAHVVENRRRMAEAMGVTPEHFLSVHQTHSPDVVVASGPWQGPSRPLADAIVTQTEGLAIAATAADCGPILLVDPNARVIGAAHAGWKGALGGVTDTAIAAMETLGARRERIAAAIGPCISQANYEGGPEFRERFAPADARFFAAGGRDGHFRFDLEGYVAMRLAASDIAHVERLSACTYAREDDYFSFRRATHRGEADYGRQVSAIVLRA